MAKSVCQKSHSSSHQDNTDYRSEESRRIQCTKCGNSHIWVCTNRTKAKARRCQAKRFVDYLATLALNEVFMPHDYYTRLSSMLNSIDSRTNHGYSHYLKYLGTKDILQNIVLHILQHAERQSTIMSCKSVLSLSFVQF
ncbi:Chaperone DnaJ-domain superfamily protein [Trifolium repens]|nr:Chaperone DnaJ-domain superfamily protein [Trifolium repens]